MTIDRDRLAELIVESQDLNADALRGAAAVLPDLADVAAARRGRPVDVDRVRHVEATRRGVLRSGGYGLGLLAARGLLATGFGAALVSIVSRPASADVELDIDILQTAASLENLAVATYGAALTLDFVAEGNATIRHFAETTMEQHGLHAEAFNAQAISLGGREQPDTNARYQAVVDAALPELADVGDVVALATTLEVVATQTYVTNMTLLEDGATKELMGSVMGVEAQHLAVLRAVAELLDAGAPHLVTVGVTDGPTDAAALPASLGSAAFPEPFEGIGTDVVSDPGEGAV